MTCLSALHFALALIAQDAPPAAYVVETLEPPEGLIAEVGGIGFAPGGQLYACTRRGEVWSIDVNSNDWSLFASGLHDPLGLVVDADGAVVVSDRCALTRLIDRDGDGSADVYSSITEQWGLSGNYHEYTFGPTRDADGNYYVGLGCASSGAGIFDILRGDYSKIGRVGRMYSPVPYRGWVMQVTPDGKVTPHAKGFREPMGMRIDSQGRLFTTDNQGDWLGTSKMFHVEPNKFYGHVISLVWDPEFEGDPLAVPVEQLEQMRTKACILFPHGKVCNSPGQPIEETTGGKFGPYQGQLLVGCIVKKRILRVALEEVGGALQGAIFRLIDGEGLRHGNGRLVWNPEGDQLYIGQTTRGWSTGRGVQRVRWTGRVPMDMHTMSLTETGFDITFTKPVDPATALDPKNYSLQHYYYHYHRPYGSPEVGNTPVEVSSVSVSEDRMTVSLTLPELLAPKVYELHVRNVRAADGSPLEHDDAYYTLHQLRTSE